MKTLLFVLWFSFDGSWVPMVAFTDLDFCYAFAERASIPAVCLPGADEPWMYEVKPEPTSRNLPRLEERV